MLLALLPPILHHVPTCCCTLAHDPIPASPSGAIWVRGRADRAQEGRSAGLEHAVAGHAPGKEQHPRAKMEALTFEKAATPQPIHDGAHTNSDDRIHGHG